MEQLYSGFIIALLLATATAGPINIDLFKDSRTCARRCIDNHKFDYSAGNVYVYEYKAVSNTSIIGASEDTAMIRIKAMVEIEPTSSCDFEMRLKDAYLIDPYRSKDARFTSSEFGDILTRYPLRFSFQDGRIEDLCPEVDEPSWSLNIKRGILSAFQNSMTRIDMDQTMSETDITGSCATKYTVSERDDSIKKTKDFVNCKHRHGLHSTIQSIGYDAESDIQSLTIMKSSYMCTQRINKDSDILEESVCTEKHIFRPFSNGDNGAATVNVQNLRFVSRKRGGNAKQGEILRRTDLLFSHQFGGRSDETAEEKIKMKLQELCRVSKDDVRPEQPTLFGELIKWMKMADADALKSIYSQIKNRKICREDTEKSRKLFVDAIPMVATSHSLMVIRDLIRDKELSDLEKDMCLASLPFIQNPEKEMISAVRPLLEDRKTEGNTILLVSSLVSGYCSVNPKCGEVMEVIEIMEVLERMIGKCSSKQPNEKTIYALRAIGNIGHSKRIVPRLTQCFTRKETPVQIRLAAIDAFRRIPCDVMRIDLLDLFNDLSEDSELRINAYLALMKCPNKSFLRRIREALREEKTNQVGSFVWTHLANLKQTSDPHMQGIREILEEEELKKEFNKDKRKFSRNYEGSFFFDEINVGAKVDSNVIFSPKSFVPRSANLNLTMDLFGRAINFFEIGTRMEGVETFLERYFGTYGYFKSKKDPVRSQKFPMRQFDDKYNVDVDSLKGFAYARMFGNELGFWQFEDPNVSFFKNFDIRKWVKDEKVSFSKNMALMDTHLIIPTILGFPLNMTVAATASVDLEAMVKMNLASFKNIEFGASIKPSAAMKVVSELIVDAFTTRAGLRMNALAHSSTEAKMSFNMKNSKVVESKLEFPKKRMEIVTFKSDFAIIQGDQVREQKMIEDNKVNKNKCTDESFNKITGMRLCTQLKYSNASMQKEAPYFPFTGPVVMQVELVNHDIPEGYLMKTHIIEATQSGFVIDTPNSKVNRKISLDIDFKKVDKKIEFDSPWKKVNFNGKYIKTRNKQLLSGELILDDKNNNVDKYSAMFQLIFSSVKGNIKWVPKIVLMSPTRKMVVDGTITKSGKRIEADLTAGGFYKDEISLKLSAVMSNREYSCISTVRVGSKEYYMKTKVGMIPKGKAVIYSPELNIIVEGKELIKFESSLLYNPKSKIIMNFKLDKVFSKIVALNARILMNSNKKKMKNLLHFNLKGPKLSIDIKGNMELKEARFTSRVVTTYAIGTYQDKLTISSKLLDESTKSLTMYNGDITVDSKKNIKNNFAVKGRFGKADNHMEGNLYLEVGNPKRKPDKFILDSILNYNLRPMEKKVNYTLSFKRPLKNVDVGLKISHLNTNKNKAINVESDFEVKYAPDKTAGANVQFEMKDKKNFEGFVSVRHLKKELFRLEDKMSSRNPQNYNNHLSVLIPDGRKVTLQSSLQKRSDKNFFTSNTLRLPNNREVKLNGQIHIERENGSLSLELDADRATIKSAPWNPKLTFDYHINMHRQKISLIKSMLTLTLSPKEKIETTYSFSMQGNELIQNLVITTPFEHFNKFECKFIHEQVPTQLKESFFIKIDDYYLYEEDLTFRYQHNELFFDYMLKQTIYDNERYDYHIKFVNDRKTTMGMIKYENLYKDRFKLELDIAHHPSKVDIKGAADINLPRNGLEFTFTSDSTYDNEEFSFKSESEVKLVHPRANFEGSYLARADPERISFDTNFVNPTSRYKNGKMAIAIAMDEQRTNLMGKFDVDFNNRRLYSLNTGYTLKNKNHNFQLGLLMQNGDRITAVFTLNMDDSKVHAEIKLPQALNSFELDMDGTVDCMRRSCKYDFHLTTNSAYIRNMNADMKRTEMGLIDAKVQFNGFDRNVEFSGKIEGEEWTEKTIMADIKVDGEEKLKLDGNYEFHSPRKWDAKFEFVSKFGRQDDKFVFNMHREVFSSVNSNLEVSAMLDLFREKYEISLKGTDFKELKTKLAFPGHDYEATMSQKRLKLHDFDVTLELRQNSKEHRFSAFNRQFEEMKFSAMIAGYSDFDIVYNGGFDDSMNGRCQLKVSYGEYFVEGSSTVKMDSQLELKTSVDFKILGMGPHPKTHTGSGEIKLTNDFDAIFQKIVGTFTYGKEKINFSSLVKNTGKINMNMRLKTTFKFNANLKAQMQRGNMYDTDLSLNFDTVWTGSKKLTYSHSGQQGKNLHIKAELGDGKRKSVDYTLELKISMKNEYGLSVELTTDNMSNKYMFEGELMLDRHMEKGKLRFEAPFEFMESKPMEISFNRERSKFNSRGSFRMMEYTMDVEYSMKSVMSNIYINWNKADRASNFKFIVDYDDNGDEKKTDTKLKLELIHPVRTVSFFTKFVQTRQMLDVDIEVSGNVKEGQKVGFGFGKTENAGYVRLSLPKRTYKVSGRVSTESGKQVFESSFFWDFDKDDSKKIDLTATMFNRNRNIIFDVILKFPSQSKGIRLKSEYSWNRGDALFKSKTEFSLNQDPQNTFTMQTELLRDDNNKYTLTMAMMHPRSNLNWLTTFRLFELNGKTTISMDMKYADQNINSMAYLDKKNNEISMQVRSQDYSAEILAHLHMEDGCEISVKIVDGSGKPMEVYFVLSHARRNLKIQVDYDKNMPEKSYRIDGNLLTNKMLMVEAYRMDADRSVSDARVDLKVENSTILHGKIVWRPTMFYELNEFLYMKAMQNMMAMRDEMKNFYRVVSIEREKLTRAFQKAYKKELTEIETYVHDEFDEVSNEMHEMIQHISEMYDRNYLNMKTIYRTMQGVHDEVRGNLLQFIKLIRHHFREGFMYYYQIAEQHMKETNAKLNHIYKESYRKLSYDVEQAKTYIVSKLSMWNREWEVARDEYLRKLNELNRRTYQAIFNHKYTKAFLMALNHRWSELVDFMRDNDMMTPVVDFIGYIQANRQHFNDEFDRFMDEIRNHPAIQDIFSILNEFYQQLYWAYKYWEVEETVRNLDDKVKNYITSTANKFREQIFSVNDVEIISFDMRRGIFEFKFPIAAPVLVDEFWQITRHVVNNFNEWQLDYNFTVADLYYSMKPSSKPIDWIPPFKAQASIFRDQHITTFDGIHLDFKGTCSYLLTRDFVDNNFTVIANYDTFNGDQKIESLLFHAGSEKIQLFRDYETRHNDQKMDLPIKLNDVSVNRIGSKMEIRGNRGFTITFDPTHGTVIVDISGWYFGKVAGLFGTYNNEQFDDMTLPEQILTEDVYELAFAWAMPGCRSRRNYAQHEIKSKRCYDWFRIPYSPFRNCFRQVEPESFYHACNTAHSPEIDICIVARFYVDRCAEKGVPLQIPKQCLMCKTKMGEMFMPGEERIFSEDSHKDEIEHSADIVFVIEQRKGNEKIVNDLNRIIQELEQTLRNEGMTNNRYGLVGFGGDNIRHEYSVTIRSELMASAGLMMNEVKKLNFYDGYSKTDALKAVSLATHYPFRPATRKAIVLVSAMFCDGETMYYDQVLRQLKDRDIALHLLQVYEFEISGNKSPKTTDLYGVDSRQVFTRTDGAAGEKMFETIKLPSGDCAELALSSNGSVFDVREMGQSDKSIFVRRFTQRIADSLEMVNCHTCYCGQNEMGMAQSICTRCPHIIGQHSSAFYLPGKLFQGNFEINENLKERLNTYWELFKKTPKKAMPKKNTKSRRRR